MLFLRASAISINLGKEVKSAIIANIDYKALIFSV